jgi:hypothetical protein
MLMEALHWNSVAVGLQSASDEQSALIPINDATAQLKTSRGFVPLGQFDASVRIGGVPGFHKNC